MRLNEPIKVSAFAIHQIFWVLSKSNTGKCWIVNFLSWSTVKEPIPLYLIMRWIMNLIGQKYTGSGNILFIDGPKRVVKCVVDRFIYYCQQRCKYLTEGKIFWQIYDRILHRRFAYDRWNVLGKSVVRNSGLLLYQPQISLLSYEDYLFQKRSEVFLELKLDRLSIL